MIGGFLEWDSNRRLFFLGGAIAGAYTAFLVLLYDLAAGISQANQALVLATVLGSLGTLALAIATFWSIYQTNRTLELKEKQVEKPLAVDELTNLIQPALDSLEKNIRAMKNSETAGCAFDWHYLDPESLETGSKGPECISTSDTFAIGRLADENPEMVDRLRYHNALVGETAQLGIRFQQGLAREIHRLLAEHDIEETSSAHNVLTTAVLQELDRLGEEHSFRVFWENNREYLLEYAMEMQFPNFTAMKNVEDDYQDYAEDLYEDLFDRKAELKVNYSIPQETVIGKEQGT